MMGEQRPPAPGHAIPLLGLDRVVRSDERSIVTEKAVREGEDYFRGHYPGYPIYPGVFMVEAIDQTARLFLRERWPGATLRQIRSRFLARVFPGDTLVNECTFSWKEVAGTPETVVVKGSCRSGEAVACTAKLVYSLSPGRGAGKEQ